MKTIVFDCNRDDMIPMTGQLLVTIYDGGLIHLAWRSSQWDTWSPPILPSVVEDYEPAVPND